MTRNEFLKTFGCTRGQLDLIIEKSRARSDGQVETEWGIFRISKKKGGKTAAVDIVPVKRSQAKPAPPHPSAGSAGSAGSAPVRYDADLMSKDTEELKRCLLVAQVMGAQQKLDSERRELRKEILGELVSSLIVCFAEFREALDQLHLDETSLQFLKDRLDRALEKAGEL